MLDYLLSYLNNYFVRSYEYTTATFNGSTISNLGGTYLVGQYVNISESVLNDGTYKVTAVNGTMITIDSNLLSEVTDCRIFGLGIPKAIIDLVPIVSITGQGVTSESQGNRSISYASGSWQEQNNQVLSQYKSMFDDRERWVRCGKLTL